MAKAAEPYLDNLLINDDDAEDIEALRRKLLEGTQTLPVSKREGRVSERKDKRLSRSYSMGKDRRSRSEETHSQERRKMLLEYEIENEEDNKRGRKRSPSYDDSSYEQGMSPEEIEKKISAKLRGRGEKRQEKKKEKKEGLITDTKLDFPLSGRNDDTWRLKGHVEDSSEEENKVKKLKKKESRKIDKDSKDKVRKHLDFQSELEAEDIVSVDVSDAMARLDLNMDEDMLDMDDAEYAQTITSIQADNCDNDPADKSSKGRLKKLGHVVKGAITLSKFSKQKQEQKDAGLKSQDEVFSGEGDLSDDPESLVSKRSLMRQQKLLQEEEEEDDEEDCLYKEPVFHTRGEGETLHYENSFDEKEEDDYHVDEMVEGLETDMLIKANIGVSEATMAMHREVEAMQEKLRDAEKDKNKFKKDLLEREKDTIENFEEQLDARNNEITELEMQLETMQGEISESRSTQIILDKKYKEIIAKDEILKRNKEEMAKIMAELSTERSLNESLRRDMETLKRELGALKGKMSQLEQNERAFRGSVATNLKVINKVKRTQSIASLAESNHILALDNDDDDRDEDDDDGENNEDDDTDDDIRFEDSPREDSRRLVGALREGVRNLGNLIVADGRPTDGRQTRERVRTNSIPTARRAQSARPYERRGEEGHNFHDVHMIREARKILQSYTWPVLEHFTSARSYRLLFEKQIADALSEGVPDHMVAKSIYQHFMKDKKTMLKFEHMATKYDFSTLAGIKKIIKHFRPEESTLTNEEIFRELKMDKLETGHDYMARLQSMDKELYPNVLGRVRRLKKQFIEGFYHQDVTLDDTDREALMLQPNLIELVLATKERINGKLRKKVRGTQEVFSIDKPDPQPQVRQYYSSSTTQQVMQQRPVIQQRPAIEQRPMVPNNDANNQRARQEMNQQQRPTTRPPLKVPYNMRVPAEPHAVRVSEEEQRVGKTSDGKNYCFNCLRADDLHISTDCKYRAFCMTCKRETNHTARGHDTAMARFAQRQNGGNFGRQISTNYGQQQGSGQGQPDQPENLTSL